MNANTILARAAYHLINPLTADSDAATLDALVILANARS